MPTATLLRSDVATLTDAAAEDLAVVWRDLGRPSQAEAILRDTLPALIDAYGAAAATVAADWYDDLRDERSVGGRFTAIPADVPDAGAQALVGWALAEARDVAGFQGLILGGTQRRIANFSRLTIAGSSIADPQARGWRRTGTGRCDFCRMLIGRGAVYTEATASFESHDSCGCQAEPAF